VYVMPDGDEGGDSMWATVKSNFKGSDVELRRIRLPKRERSKKLDPDNMPVKMLKNLVVSLVDKHAFSEDSITEY